MLDLIIAIIVTSLGTLACGVIGIGFVIGKIKIKSSSGRCTGIGIVVLVCCVTFILIGIVGCIMLQQKIFYCDKFKEETQIEVVSLSDMIELDIFDKELLVQRAKQEPSKWTLRTIDEDVYIIIYYLDGISYIYKSPDLAREWYTAKE